QYIERKGLRGAVLSKERAEAQARLEQVQRRKERGTMSSPVDGVVLSRPVSNERLLPAGTLLVEVGQLDRLEVEADLLSQDVGDVAPDKPVSIHGPAVGTR